MGYFRVLNYIRLLVFHGFAVALIICAGSGVAAQERSVPGTAGPQARTGSGAKKASWSLLVSRNTPRTFTVRAKDAPLVEITAEFARILKVPFSLSPLMTKQRVTLDFSGMNLEASLRLLAPHPYIDYVAGEDNSVEPRPLAVYLHALNEQPPSTSATVRGTSEAILFEGNTEDGEEEPKDEEEPLKITYARSQLSVRARKQPLSIVLFKVAHEVGVPFELRHDSTEVIDVDFTNYSLDQAVRSLSPYVRFYYRTDLQTFEIQPLRITLVAPGAGRS